MAPLHIGVLVLPPVQLLDLAPVDLLAMTSRAYFEACNMPAALLAEAIPAEEHTITYVAPGGAGSVGQTTANARVAIDAGIGDEKVAPGRLDVLFIPGPEPGTKPGEEVREWVRGHVREGVELLTVCTGVFVAGYAGVLDGKRATGPRGMLEGLKREFPEVRWEDRRYVNEGKMWTCGGISNGLDLVAVFMKKRWPGVLSDTVLRMAEVEARAEEYE